MRSEPSNPCLGSMKKVPDISVHVRCQGFAVVRVSSQVSGSHFLRRAQEVPQIRVSASVKGEVPYQTSQNHSADHVGVQASDYREPLEGRAVQLDRDKITPNRP
jgi:hypothetical protein